MQMALIQRCSYCDARVDGNGYTGFIRSLLESLSYLHAKRSKEKVGSMSSTDSAAKS